MRRTDGRREDAGRSRTRGPNIGFLIVQLRGELSDAMGTGFLTGVGASVATRFWLVLVGLVTSVVVTRALGPEGRGYYAVALTISMIGTQLGVLGFNRSNIWAVAKKPDLLGPLLGNSLLVSLVAGALAALVVGVALGSSFFESPVPVEALVLVLVSIPIGIALTLVGNLFLGLERIRDYNTMKLANRMGAATASVLLVALGIADVRTLLVGIVAVGGFVAVVGAVRLGRIAAGPVTVRLPLLRSHIGYGLRAYPVSVLTFLLLRVDILLVQAYLGATETGYYAVAVALVEVLRIIPATLGLQLLTRLIRDGREGGRWRTTRLSTVSVGVLMSAVAVVAAVFSGFAITVLYGDEFAAAVEPFLVLLPGLVMIAMNGVLTSYLGSIGMPRGAMSAPLVAIVLNVVLNLVLIPGMGITGAALASTVSYGVMLLITVLYIRLASPPDTGFDGQDGMAEGVDTP